MSDVSARDRPWRSCFCLSAMDVFAAYHPTPFHCVARMGSGLDLKQCIFQQACGGGAALGLHILEHDRYELLYQVGA